MGWEAVLGTADGIDEVIDEVMDEVIDEVMLQNPNWHEPDPEHNRGLCRTGLRC